MMRAVGYKPSAKVADTGRMWTKSIWDEIPWDQIKAGQREGVAFFDEFKNFPALGAVDADLHEYACYSDAGSTFQQTTSEYGEVALVLDTTDNDEGWIQTGGNTGALAKFIKMATGVPHTIAFEARIKKSSITVGGMFVGFGDPGLAAVDTMVDTAHATDDMSDNNYIGFIVPGGDPNGLDFFYQADGQTGQTKIADLHTIVADAYVKVGLLYHYKNAAAKQIKVYKNGVVNGTFVTKADVDAVTFPESDDLALLFGGKNTSGATNTFTMDWWRMALVVNA